MGTALSRTDPDMFHVALFCQMLEDQILTARVYDKPQLFLKDGLLQADFDSTFGSNAGGVAEKCLAAPSYLRTCSSVCVYCVRYQDQVLMARVYGNCEGRLLASLFQTLRLIACGWC